MKSRSGQPNRFGKVFEHLLEKYQIIRPESITLSNFASRLLHDIVEQPICSREGCQNLVRVSISKTGPIKSPYCCMTCYKKDPNAGMRISNIKTSLYANAEWKNAVENKKIASNFARYGSAHVMQNIQIFEKQQKSCFSNAKEINGMRLIGYEPFAYAYLEMLYGDRIVSGSSYLRENNLKIQWSDESGGCHQSFPDFYIEDERAFVEVKSAYTREMHDYKLMKAKEAINKLGYNYVIMVMNRGKMKSIRCVSYLID